MLKKLSASLFGLRHGITVKVYDGYGDQDNIIVYGHVLRQAPRPPKRIRNNLTANTMALLRLFMVRPVPNVKVGLRWMGERHTAVTSSDGFFKIEWCPAKKIEPGWHEVTVSLAGADGRSTRIEGRAKVYTPFGEQVAIISDIDDTFLISHSAQLRKRLFVLLTENATSRRPFENVVDHYRALAIGTGALAEPNPFFYVSSSEWNLYDYIHRFCEVHGLPRGILLLSPMKRLANVWKTGQGKHSEKFVRIARIMRSYPHHQYILLGDDTQRDPYIYASIVEHFPGKVLAVYVRRVRRRNETRVMEQIEKIKASGVECCYFAHSRDAIEHSRRMGFIR